MPFTLGDFSQDFKPFISYNEYYLMEINFSELFDQQKQLINHYFDELCPKSASAFLNAVLECKGSILFSGVGKSGFVAQKIVATLTSTGTRAYFLPPTDALHGDMGVVREGDLFVAISKSGESDELIALLPFIEQKGAKMAALVSRKNSRLEKRCHLSVVLPVLRELCPHNLAPTTSTAVQLLFGDAIAVALMRIKGTSVLQFASNHPGGLIGRKISLKVADLMLKEEALPICKKTDRLIDVLHELSRKQCGCVLVLDEIKALHGIFTDGDLRRALEKFGSSAIDQKIETLMTASPHTIQPFCLAMEAMEMMEKDPKKPVTVLPVMEENQVVGLIRMHDILQAGLK